MRYSTFFAALPLLAVASAAHADFKVQVPYVDYRELELEHKGFASFDRKPELRNNQDYIAEIGYGLFPWLSTHVEGEWEREPGIGNPTRFRSYGWENVIQFTERGEYWADLGFFAEIEHQPRKSAPDETTFGPIVSKELGPTLNTLNLFLVKELGSTADKNFSLNYRWQTRFQIHPAIEPGIEIHGQPSLGHFGGFQTQDHRAGPMLYGTIVLAPYGNIKYEAGYLFGLTRAAPAGTLKWGLEYEIAF